MALIGKIRKNSWLLIVLIALGLGGFIFMDMFSGQQSIFGSTQFTVGEIDGNKIDWNEFVRTEQMLYSNTADPFSARSALWNFYLEETIVKKEAEGLGLGVSKDELIDLQFGSNLSPIITQRFRDPNSGQVDRAQLNQIKQQIENNTLDPTVRPFWAHQEKEIIKERLQSKLSTLVSKAMYTPQWQAESLFREQNRRIDLAYVQIPFDEVPDSEVTLTDEDYSSYLAENKEQYRQDEETRTVEYLTFNIEPTAQDSAELKQNISNLIPRFATAENDSAFAVNNFGSIEPTFLKKSEVSQAIADTVFTMPAGQIYGPYIDAGTYKAVKLVNRLTIPDSVRSRHILIRANNIQQAISARNTIDSLRTLIDNGTHSFDSLSMKFSQDASNASKGGDLGYTPLGRMVPPFEKFIFYDGKVGEPGIVATQFGIHLVEVLDRKYGAEREEGVRLAYLNEPIVPSPKTQDSLYNIVLEFVGTNRSADALRTSAESTDYLELQTTVPLKENDYNIAQLGGGQSSRDIVRWAFNGNTRIGDVSPEIYIYEDPINFYNNKYVVASLKSIRPAGEPTVDNVKDQIESAVRNQKKVDILKSRISSNDLAQIANSYATEIDTARSVSFSSGFIPGLGQEPKVLAKAFTSNLNEVSEAMGGNNGVFVFKVIKETPSPEPSNLSIIKRTQAQQINSQVRASLMPAMKEETKVKDYRSRFY
jgi:peptidyl-prolyl cis-trans isomerase D